MCGEAAALVDYLGAELGSRDFKGSLRAGTRVACVLSLFEGVSLARCEQGAAGKREG